MDPDVLSRTLPGCERLEATGEGGFAGVLNVQVGPVRGQFQGTLDLTETRPPESYRMRLQGQGPSGFMNGEGTVRLEEAAPGTILHYDLDAQVGGRIAGVGQRLLDSSGRVIARQGLEGLERQLAAREAAPAAPTAAAPAGTAGGDAGEPAPPAATATPTGPAASDTPATGAAPAASPAAPAGAPTAATPGPARPPHAEAPPAPSQAAFAAGFLRGMWRELVPARARPWVLAGVALAALLLVLLLVRACG